MTIILIMKARSRMSHLRARIKLACTEGICAYRFFCCSSLIPLSQLDMGSCHKKVKLNLFRVLLKPYVTLFYSVIQLNLFQLF